MSCCPPNAEKFLASNYVPTGAKHTLPNGYEFYEVGNADSKKAVIMIPDIWGWDSGRSRNVADLLSEQYGYFVVIPKLLQPAFEGGTDGDALPPDFSPQARWPEFKEYLTTISWEGVLKPRLAAVVQYLIQEKGIEKMALSGYCWGGWVCALALQDTEQLSDKFLCAVVPHPSIQLETMVLGKDTAALLAKCTRPMLWMPTKGDPEQYHNNGEWFIALKAKHPTSECNEDYLEYNHGFLPRADTVANPEMLPVVQSAIDVMGKYFEQHFNA